MPSYLHHITSAIHCQVGNCCICCTGWKIKKRLDKLTWIPMKSLSRPFVVTVSPRERQQYLSMLQAAQHDLLVPQMRAVVRRTSQLPDRLQAPGYPVDSRDTSYISLH